MDVSGQVTDVRSHVTAGTREEKLRRLVITEPARNNVSIFACCSTPVTLPKAPVASAEVHSALLTVVEPRPTPESSQEQVAVTPNLGASNDPVVAVQQQAQEQKSKSESS
jgi:hypothetical protein